MITKANMISKRNKILINTSSNKRIDNKKLTTKNIDNKNKIKDINKSKYNYENNIKDLSSLKRNEEIFFKNQKTVKNSFSRNIEKEKIQISTFSIDNKKIEILTDNPTNENVVKLTKQLVDAINENRDKKITISEFINSLENKMNTNVKNSTSTDNFSKQLIDVIVSLSNNNKKDLVSNNIESIISDKQNKVIENDENTNNKKTLLTDEVDAINNKKILSVNKTNISNNKITNIKETDDQLPFKQNLLNDNIKSTNNKKDLLKNKLPLSNDKQNLESNNNVDYELKQEGEIGIENKQYNKNTNIEYDDVSQIKQNLESNNNIDYELKQEDEIKTENKQYNKNTNIEYDNVSQIKQNLESNSSVDYELKQEDEIEIENKQYNKNTDIEYNDISQIKQDLELDKSNLNKISSTKQGMINNSDILSEPNSFNGIFNGDFTNNQINVMFMIHKTMPLIGSKILNKIKQKFTNPKQALNDIAESLGSNVSAITQGMTDFNIYWTPFELTKLITTIPITIPINKGMTIKSITPYKVNLNSELPFGPDSIRNDPDLQGGFNWYKSKITLQRSKFQENIDGTGNILVRESNGALWKIPFQFTPVLRSQNLQTFYNQKKILNRIGNIYTFNGVSNLTISIGTQYVATKGPEGLTPESILEKTNLTNNIVSTISRFMSSPTESLTKIVENSISNLLKKQDFNLLRSDFINFWDQKTIDQIMYNLRALQLPEYGTHGYDFSPPPLVGFDFGPESNILQKLFWNKDKRKLMKEPRSFVVGNLTIDQNLQNYPIRMIPKYNISANSLIKEMEKKIPINKRRSVTQAISNILGDNPLSLVLQGFDVSMTLYEVNANIYRTPASFEEYWGYSFDYNNTENNNLVFNKDASSISGNPLSASEKAFSVFKQDLILKKNRLETKWTRTNAKNENKSLSQKLTKEAENLKKEIEKDKQTLKNTKYEEIEKDINSIQDLIRSERMRNISNLTDEDKRVLEEYATIEYKIFPTEGEIPQVTQNNAIKSLSDSKYKLTKKLREKAKLENDEKQKTKSLIIKLSQLNKLGDLSEKLNEGLYKPEWPLEL